MVFPALVRVVPSLLARSFDFSFDFVGVWLGAGPVPVKVQSETPSSRCLGELRPRAMFDFGESRWARDDLETALAKCAVRLPP